MKHEKRPVSLEDLLRLKRAERPPAEFWPEFDRQLRTKQLSALVARRPWWHGLAQAFAGVRRYSLPIGATAALAITFLTLREDTVGPRSEMLPAVPAAAGQIAESADTVTRAILAESPAVVGADTQALAVATSTEVAAKETEIAVELMPVAAATEVARSEGPWVSALFAGPEETESFTPSARHIAANFAVAKAAEPIGTMLLGKAHEFGAHRSEVRTAAVEPLQQMALPAEMRRARYLTAMVSKAAVENSARTSERMANRISAEELYDQVERFGTRRGGFNVKF